MHICQGVNSSNRQRDELFLQCLQCQQEKTHRSLSAFLQTLSGNSSTWPTGRPEASPKSARFSCESGRSSMERRGRDFSSGSLIDGKQRIDANHSAPNEQTMWRSSFKPRIRFEVLCASLVQTPCEFFPVVDLPVHSRVNRGGQ